MGESARRKQPAMDETYAFRDSFQKLCDEPTVDALINCTPGIYVLGVPKEVRAACHAVLEHLQKTSARLDDDNIKFALQLLSYAAVLAQDENLADSVGQFAIEKVRELNDDELTGEIICRLAECSSAYTDRKKAAETLARWLEAVSFLAKPSASIDLHDSLNHLQLLEDSLSERLGRAWLRLGLHGALPRLSDRQELIPVGGVTAGHMVPAPLPRLAPPGCRIRGSAHMWLMGISNSS